MTKRQHPKDESGSEKTEEQTSPEDSQPQKNPKDKSDEHEMHKSSHYHQHHDTTSNYKHPHWAGFYSKNSLILTFSPREKELAILIALPVNDHLLIYRGLCSFKLFLKAMDWFPANPSATMIIP